MNQLLRNAVLFVVLLRLGCFGLVTDVSAQNPAHFYIGQNEFQNTEVYSLKYHPNGLLYAATNYGLYAYQHGQFRSIPWLGDHQGSSLFLLTLDSKNNLYCSNLSGEIFRLEEDGLALYKSVPEDFLSTASFSFCFDQEDDLVVLSAKLAREKGSEWDVFAELPPNAQMQLNTKNRDTILVNNPIDHSLYSITKSGCQKLSKLPSSRSIETLPERW